MTVWVECVFYESIPVLARHVRIAWSWWVVLSFCRRKFQGRSKTYRRHSMVELLLCWRVSELAPVLWVQWVQVWTCDASNCANYAPVDEWHIDHVNLLAYPISITRVRRWVSLMNEHRGTGPPYPPVIECCLQHFVARCLGPLDTGHYLLQRWL